MENEIWKDIPGYEGHYMISTHGRVKGIERYINHPRGGKKFQKETMKPLNRDSHGYILVRLVKDTIGKTYRVHRLVMNSFVGESNLMVDHINNIPHDNRLENLRYVTAKENAHYYRKHLNKDWQQTIKHKRKKYMELPKNITYRKDINRYSIRMTIDNKYKSMGCFVNLNDAINFLNQNITT